MAGGDQQFVRRHRLHIERLHQVPVFHPHRGGAVVGLKHDLRRNVVVVRRLDHVENVFFALIHDGLDLISRLLRHRRRDQILGPAAFGGGVVGHKVSGEVRCQLLRQGNERLLLVVLGVIRPAVEVVLPARTDVGEDFLQRRLYVVAPTLRRVIPGAELFRRFVLGCHVGLPPQILLGRRRRCWRR